MDSIVKQIGFRRDKMLSAGRYGCNAVGRIMLKQFLFHTPKGNYLALRFYYLISNRHISVNILLSVPFPWSNICIVRYSNLLLDFIALNNTKNTHLH